MMMSRKHSNKSGSKKLSHQERILFQKDEQLKRAKLQNESIEQENTELLRQIQELKAKLAEQEALMRDYERERDSEKEELLAKISEQKTEIDKLSSYKHQFENSNKGEICLHIQCPEKSLYPNEIEDYIKGILFREVKHFADSIDSGNAKDSRGFSRLHDVQKALFKANPDFDFEKSGSFRQLHKFIDDTPGSSQQLVRHFEQNGFVKDEAGKGHIKLSFYGDSRYCVTLSISGSDKRAVKNCKEEARHFFLYKPR